MNVLPDLLRPGLDVVFVGTAASKTSAAQRAPYVGPGNTFWDILHETGLIPQGIDPTVNELLLQHGVGFTNMAPNAIGNDDVLTTEDFDPDGVRAKIEQVAPRVLAFVGKRAAQEFFGRKQIDYGLQPDRVGDTAVWVLPSTSGAARRYWDPSIWHAMAAYLRQNNPTKDS